MDDLARDVMQLWERLDGERGTWRAHWQDCANYMQPERRDYIMALPQGGKRMERIFDSTPVLAHQQFAAGVHALLTSPTLQWFWLKPADERLMDNDDVMSWLNEVSTRMYGLFSSEKHNFASQSNELYLDIGLIGTGVMAVLESQRSGILFSCRNLKECVIDENEEDRVDTLVRRWTYTAKQAFQAWGASAGPAVLAALEHSPQRQMDFLHAVRPRLRRDPARSDAKHKPFESVYVAALDGTIISQGGFDEFPYMVPRFSKASGETYGRGPGMTVLPDVKMLNEMARTVLKAAQKVVDPPLNVPDDGYLMAVKTTPGSLNYYRPGSRDRIEPIQTHGDVRLGLDMLDSYRTAIMRGFYVEWMMMPSDPHDPASAGKGVTATYVLQQRDEKMRLLSPMLARLQSEFLGPLIDRVFSILWRQSKAMNFAPGAPLPMPPQVLSGTAIKTEYVSPIAVAQRSSQLDSVMRLVQTALMLAQADPEAPKTLDVDAILRLTAKDLNTPTAALKSAERVQAEAQARAQAAAEMNAHAQAASLAGAAKDGTQAVKNLATAGQAAQAAGSGNAPAGNAPDATPVNDNLAAA